MNVAQLNRAIEQGKFPPLLLLHGEESFLLEKALGRLRDAAVPPEARDFNFNLYHGREVRAEDLLDTARTFPVFGSHRLIIVKGMEDVPAAELETLLSYLKNPIPETILVLTAGKIDGRRKFFQEFRKKGEMVEFRRLNEAQIPECVQEMARESGLSLTADGMAMFCRRVGTSLQEVHGELTKLFSYLGDRTLADVDDVAAVVSDTRVDNIFDLANALGRREIGDAVRLLNRLLGEGMAPLLILNMMTRHFRQMWMVRELIDQGLPAREIAGRIGINPYFLEGIAGQARRFSPMAYRRSFELFLETDLALKSGGAHPAARLEKLLLEIACG